MSNNQNSNETSFLSLLSKATLDINDSGTSALDADQPSGTVVPTTENTITKMEKYFTRFSQVETKLVAGGKGKYWRFFKFITPPHPDHEKSVVCLICSGFHLEEKKKELDFKYFKFKKSSYNNTHIRQLHGPLYEYLKNKEGQVLVEPSEEDLEYIERVKSMLLNYFQIDIDAPLPKDDEVQMLPHKRKRDFFKKSTASPENFKYYIATWLMTSGRPSTVVDDK